MFRYLPEQASEVAPRVDWIHHLITDLSVFFTVAIVGSMLYFAFKYRARNGVDHDTPQIEGSHLLEILWTVVPTIICIFVGTYGIIIYKELRASPKDALVINVTGRQWKWDFQYENGKRTTSEAVIPVDTDVKFVLAASDVLHSFFIPSMRVKSDAIPGQYTYVSFKPIKTGDYDIFCTEYCGTEHSSMLAKLRVVSKEEYTRWLNDNSSAIKFKPTELGRQLYADKGCVTCHSLDGTKKIGPSLLKLYGREGAFTDGVKYVADDNYIRESILDPKKHVVAGYDVPSLMPSFQGLIGNEEISALIAFMRTLDGNQPVSDAPQFSFAKAAGANLSPAERGKAIYNSQACIGCHSLDGSKVVGPTFKGLYERKEKVVGGAEIVADEAYLKESIINPNEKIVEGFAPNQMPGTYGTQLSEGDIADVIEFIKSVK